MAEKTAGEIRNALHLMQQARDILFSQLSEPSGRSREVAEGLDSLFRAIEFAEKPEIQLQICPVCNCLYFAEVQENLLSCLSCDAVWQRDNGTEV